MVGIKNPFPLECRGVQHQRVTQGAGRAWRCLAARVARGRWFALAARQRAQQCVLKSPRLYSLALIESKRPPINNPGRARATVSQRMGRHFQRGLPPEKAPIVNPPGAFQNTCPIRTFQTTPKRRATAMLRLEYLESSRSLAEVCCAMKARAAVRRIGTSQPESVRVDRLGCRRAIQVARPRDKARATVHA